MKEKIEARKAELLLLIRAANLIPEHIDYGFPEDGHTKSPLAHMLVNWSNELTSLKLITDKVDLDAIMPEKSNG